jgi:hypothetical protein
MSVETLPFDLEDCLDIDLEGDYHQGCWAAVDRPDTVVCNAADVDTVGLCVTHRAEIIGR